MAYYVQLPNGDFITDIPDDVPQDAVMKWASSTMPEAFAGRERSWGEAATDVGAGVVEGIGGLMQVPGMIGSLITGNVEEEPTGLQGIGEDVAKWAQEQKSLTLKGKQAALQQKVDATEGELGKFWETFKGTATDVPLLIDFLAQNVPNLTAIGVVGNVTKLGAKKLIADATEEAVKKAGVRGALATGAAMQGAEVGTDTYEAIYERSVKAGVPEEQAHEQALQGARTAAIESAALSLAASRLPGGTEIEKALVGGKLPGVKQLRNIVAAGGVKAASKAASKASAGIVGGALGEAASEGLEEGGGKFISNVNVADVFPDQPLTAGVGQSTAQGVLIGGAFGGGAGAVTSRRDSDARAAYEQAMKDVEAARQQQAQQAQQATQHAQLTSRQQDLAADNIQEDPRAQQSRFRYAPIQGDLFGEYTTGQPAPQYSTPAEATPAARVHTEDASFDVDGQGRLQMPGAPAAPTLYVSPDSARVAQRAMAQSDSAPMLGYVAPDNTFRPVADLTQIPEGAQPSVGVVNTTTGQLIDAFKADPIPMVGQIPVMQVVQPEGSSVQFGSRVERVEPIGARADMAPQEQVEMRGVTTRAVDDAMMDEMGIPKRNTKLRDAIRMKDMNNPLERQQVLDALEKYGETTSSPKVATALEKFLGSDIATRDLYAGAEPTADQAWLDAIGVPKHAAMRKRLNNADLNNPAERQRVYDDIRQYGDRARNPEVRDRINEFFAQVGEPALAEKRTRPAAPTAAPQTQGELDFGTPAAQPAATTAAPQTQGEQGLGAPAPQPAATTAQPVQGRLDFGTPAPQPASTTGPDVDGQTDQQGMAADSPVVAETEAATTDTGRSETPATGGLAAADGSTTTDDAGSTGERTAVDEGGAGVTDSPEARAAGIAGVEALTSQKAIDDAQDAARGAASGARKARKKSEPKTQPKAEAPAGETTAAGEVEPETQPKTKAPVRKAKKKPAGEKSPMKVVDDAVSKQNPTKADQEKVAEAIEPDLDTVLAQTAAAAEGTPAAKGLPKKIVTAKHMESWYAARVLDSLSGKWRAPGDINPREMMLRLIASDMHIGGADVSTDTPLLFQYSDKRAKKVYDEILTDVDRAQVDKLLAEMEAEAEAGNKYLGNYTSFQEQIADYLGNDDIAEVKRVYQSQTSNKLIAAMVSGNPVAALTEISRNPKFDNHARAVARMLLRHGNNYGFPALSLVDRNQLRRGADGQYNAITDTVQFTMDGADAHVLLHEISHGFLHSAIVRAEATGKWTPELKRLKDMYERVRDERWAKDGTYALTNLTEFVSEALSNREFQALLSTIPANQTRQAPKSFARSVWDNIKSAIRSFFGSSAPVDIRASVLDEILFAADRSMPLGREVQIRRIGLSGKNAVVSVNRTGHNVMLEQAGYAPDFLANQGVKPPSTDPLIERAKKSTATLLDTLETRWFSSDAALNNAVRREIEKNETDWNIVKETLLKMSTSQAVHANAVANVFLDMGNLRYDTDTYKWVGAEDGNSWRSILQDIQAAAETYGMSFDDFRSALHAAFVAERTKALRNAEIPFTAPLTDEQVEAGLAFFDMYPELRQIQAKWNNLRRNVLDIGVDSGIFTREYADQLLEAGEYVPFDRVGQVEAGAISSVASRNLSSFAKPKKIKGSEQEINDVMDNMERWAAYTVASAVRNKQAAQMYQIAKQLMPDEVEELSPDTPTKKEDNTTLVWIDGVRKKVKFDDPLWVEAFVGIEGAAIPASKTLVAMSNFLRKNVVLYPLFSISQLSQDAVSAMFTSGLKNPLRLPLDVVSEFVKTIRGTSKIHKDFYRYGAVGVMDATAPMSAEAGIDSSLHKPSWWRKQLRPLEKFAMASDNAVRQAIIRRTLLETGGVEQADGTIIGGDRGTAAERAFEVINFKRSGSSASMNWLRQVIPFFNAYLQAQNVMMKVATGRGISPIQRKEAYKRLGTTTAKAMTLALLYTAMVADDEEYQRMDPTTRDRHLVVPGTGIMVPLRSDFTLMPKMFAEYAYLNLTDHGTTDGTKTRRAIKDAFLNAAMSPTVVPQAIKPVVEVSLNRNFFTGRPIVGAGIEGRAKELQFTTTTSELAKMLSKFLPLAPVEVDHLIRGFGGTTSGLITSTAEVLAIAANPDLARTPRSARDLIATAPGMSAFLAREQGTGLKNDFYELREKVNEAVVSLNMLKKDGYNPEAQQEYRERNRELLQVRSQVNAIERQLSMLRRRKNQLDTIPMNVMSVKEKLAEIDRLNAAENRMLSNVTKLRERAGL